jgi:2-hydroxychromene-2-carboxylate isomerase
MAGSSTASRTFFFDLADPTAYLEAERLRVEDPAVEWVPVLAPPAFRCAEEVASLREDVERSAAALGLQPIRWPDPFPFDSELAMLAATYARQIGRAVAFSLAAFRQAFAAGRDLGAPDNVLIAAAACEMHPRAVLKGAALHSIATALEDATALAARRGVHDVPALWLPLGQDGGGHRGRVFHGEDALDGVARALTA